MIYYSVIWRERGLAFFCKWNVNELGRLEEITQEISGSLGIEGDRKEAELTDTTTLVSYYAINQITPFLSLCEIIHWILIKNDQTIILNIIHIKKTILYEKDHEAKNKTFFFFLRLKGWGTYFPMFSGRICNEMSLMERQVKFRSSGKLSGNLEKQEAFKYKIRSLRDDNKWMQILENLWIWLY